MLSKKQADVIGKGYLAIVERGKEPVPQAKKGIDVMEQVQALLWSSPIVAGKVALPVNMIEGLLNELGNLRAVVESQRVELKPLSPSIVRDDVWLTVAEYAQIHGKSIYTVYDWKRNDRIDWKPADGRKGILVRDMMPRRAKKSVRK